jgi:uncharacterized damage-inducible protein DinB
MSFMTGYFTILAKYNRDTNGKVLDIIGALSSEDRNKDKGSFAKSLHGLLNHILEATLFFARQFKNAFPEKNIFTNEYMNKKTEFGIINFPDFEEASRALKAIDEDFVNFADTLTEECLEKNITVKFFTNSSEMRVGFFFMQAMVHNTHHRGEIAQILDEMGVKNDYSAIKGEYAK